MNDEKPPLMQQSETDDRSIHNAPHGQQVVLPAGGIPSWMAVFLAIGMGLCVLFSAMSWVSSSRSAERAFQAQQSAAINREYAVQVVGQLNRMGYPVMSPGEKDHPLALPEDYEKLDAFARQKQESQP